MRPGNVLSALKRISDFGWKYFLHTETFVEFSKDWKCPLSSVSYHSTCLAVSPLQYLTYISLLQHNKYSQKQAIKCITNAVYGSLHLPGSQIYIMLLSMLNRRRAQETHLLKYNSDENKSVYRQHKLRMYYLLQGTNHDAVSGWLLLASYFYVNKQYNKCICVIKTCFSKCTVEKNSCAIYHRHHFGK